MEYGYLGPVKCSFCTRSELLEYLAQLLNDRTLIKGGVVCINAHIYNMACSSKTLRDFVNSADVVAADGMSIVWAASYLGFQLSERCNMTDTFKLFLQRRDMPPTKAILIGCTEDELSRATEYIHANCTHCVIVGAYTGYLPVDDYRERLHSHSEFDMVLVGAGTPKSETIVSKITDWMPDKIVWHIGGGTIRILAGTMSEAPEWMRLRGLQWLHRMISEPGTLWKRYLLGNPLFVLNIFRSKLR